ncbi:MAG TPA: hypothetical protein VMV10_17775 [Pirellulales bacterium]|nr:hypothetical protein [Pirellulales bacterium]
MEQEWRALHDAHNKTPAGPNGKDRFVQIQESIERIFSGQLTADEVRKLAAAADELPAEIEEFGFTADALAFLVKRLTEMEERERLVELLATRCPTWVRWPTHIEYHLASQGERFEQPILILGDAYSRCKSQQTRKALIAAVRRGFRGYEIEGSDDAEYVKNAMQWYLKNGSDLEFNYLYVTNDSAYPVHPLFVEKGEAGTDRYHKRLRARLRAYPRTELHGR